MKKLLLLISIIFISNKGFSQSYIPFPDSAANWVNAVYTLIQYPPPAPIGTGYWSLVSASNYCVDGRDTLIGSNKYTVVSYCGGVYKGAMRDDNGKWFFIPKDSTNELLLFDFNLHLNDTATFAYEAHWGNGFSYMWSSIVGEDSILVNGKFRKRLYYGSSQWIEGIGNSKGLLKESFANLSSGLYNLQLNCMSFEDTTLYLYGKAYPLQNPGIPGACALNLSSDEISNKTSDINIFPNPSNGVFTISINQPTPQYSISVFDYLGKQILAKEKLTQPNIEIDISNSPNGIYLVQVIDEFGKVATKRVVKTN